MSDPEKKDQEKQDQEKQDQEKKVPEADPPKEASTSKKETEGEEEEKEECGWCRWMKAGGCKTEFETWLSCVDAIRDAGREDVESCSTTMVPLWDCMQKNADYYAYQLESLKGRSPPSNGDEDPSSLLDGEEDGELVDEEPPKASGSSPA